MGKTDKKIRIFSALEVANICGVVNQTAINWIKNGYLEAFTTPGGQYRVYAEDLMSFLTSRGMRVPSELQELVDADPVGNTVLVVDDDQDLNNLIKQFLAQKRPDYTLLQAFDGFEAGRMIAESRPGIIILDVDLPGLDGKKLCSRIKQESSYGSPIVLAISGYAVEGIREEMLAQGADAFLAKPLELSEVLEIIDSLVS